MTAESNGNGRRFAPSFRNELSLGNVLVILGLIAGAFAFALRYEGRLTTAENNTGFVLREIDRLDRDIGLSRDVLGLRRDTRTLVDQHRRPQ